MTARQVAQLAEMLRRLNEGSRETGWHCTSLVLSCGDGEAEISVSVRWVPQQLHQQGEYVAEIR